MTVFGPARLGPLTLKNRIIKSATFEGASPKGAVTDALIAFHERVARGGAAMTTVAYLAVAPEGRTDRHCLQLSAESLPGLRRLTEAVHAAGAMASAQIGHAGPVANSKSNGAPALSPSRRFGASGSLTRAVTEDDIARITEDYRVAGARAVEAGFDCIEIHLGHNYLLSSFLSPKLNRRTDSWGGTLLQRARFPAKWWRRYAMELEAVWPSPPSSTWPTACPVGSISPRASSSPACSRRTGTSMPWS